MGNALGKAKGNAIRHKGPGRSPGPHKRAMTPKMPLSHTTTLKSSRRRAMSHQMPRSLIHPPLAGHVERLSPMRPLAKRMERRQPVPSNSRKAMGNKRHRPANKEAIMRGWKKSRAISNKQAPQIRRLRVGITRGRRLRVRVPISRRVRVGIHGSGIIKGL